MKRSTHEPVNPNPNQGKNTMPGTTKKQTALNPNQGKNTMPSTTKKKTTATIMAPPTSTAAPPSPALSGTTAILSVNPDAVRGKTQVINGLVTLLGGLSANYAESDTFELPSGTFTIPELTQQFDAYIASAGAVGAADVAYHAAVGKEQGLRASAVKLRAELKAYIASRIGKSANGMLAYGFAPAKTPVTSPKARVAGAAKAEATRTARGTMGPKQKAEIVGNVGGMTYAPLIQTLAPAGATTQSAASALPAPVTTLPTKS